MRGEQKMGSWKPQVPLRYLGCRKPVKLVSVPLIVEFWSGLNMFLGDLISKSRLDLLIVM